MQIRGWKFSVSILIILWSFAYQLWLVQSCRALLVTSQIRNSHVGPPPNQSHTSILWKVCQGNLETDLLSNKRFNIWNVFCFFFVCFFTPSDESAAFDLGDVHHHARDSVVVPASVWSHTFQRLWREEEYCYHNWTPLSPLITVYKILSEVLFLHSLTVTPSATQTNISLYFCIYKQVALLWQIKSISFFYQLHVCDPDFFFSTVNCLCGKRTTFYFIFHWVAVK